MLYVIGFLLFSFVIISVLFYLIEHSPSGWEDENGFHPDPVTPQEQHAVQPDKAWVKSGSLVSHSS